MNQRGEKEKKSSKSGTDSLKLSGLVILYIILVVLSKQISYVRFMNFLQTSYKTLANFL